MTKELSKIDNSLMELQNTQKLCQTLMQSPHYKKIGPDGIFAIVETAKSVGVDPLHALNGGMYFVKGRVEMSSMMMNTLIRQAGHSITKDKRSNDTVCILHGKRADTNDTWVESFSIEDAKRAGVAGGMSWRAYPKDMLFARALSRLARQLFPDVIKGCYVQGEVSSDTAIPTQSDEIALESERNIPEIPESSIHSETIGEDGAQILDEELLNHPEYREQVISYLERQEIDMRDIPIEHADKIYARLEKIREESMEVAHG